MTLEREDSRAEGRAEGEIIGIIRSYKHLGKTKEETKSYLIEIYNLTEEEAAQLITEHWDNV